VYRENASYPTSNLTIINNLVMGCPSNFSYFHSGVGGSYPDGLINCLIANNTFVNALYSGAVTIADGGSHSNTVFENNIAEQANGLPVIYYTGVNASGGITFAYNNWSKTAPSNVQGTGDVVGSPLMAETGSVAEGVLTAQYFMLTANSPAIGKAAAMSQVTVDYFGNPRGSSPDIGADQHTTQLSPPQDLRVISISFELTRPLPSHSDGLCFAASEPRA
jgi:hypothetical protein